MFQSFSILLLKSSFPIEVVQSRLFFGNFMSRSGHSGIYLSLRARSPELIISTIQEM